jgi:hypothetical protein
MIVEWALAADAGRRAAFVLLEKVMNRNLTNDESHAPTVRIDEPVIAININQQYPHVKNDDELFKCTSGIWRVSRKRANKARYAFAVYRGVIKEVYEIDEWIPARQATLDWWKERERAQGNDFSGTHGGRSEFLGRVASDAARDKFVGRRLPVGHVRNPILYFNC